MSRLVLRGFAVAIAIAGLIDPAFTVARPPIRELIAIDLTDAASDRVVAELQAVASGWQIVQRRATSGRLPCGAHERCVAIADGSVDVAVPFDVGALSMVAVRAVGTSNIALRSAVVSAGHAAAAGSVSLELSRVGDIDKTDIRIRDGEAIVGSATHVWNADREATVIVPWWPLGVGARALRIEAVPAEGESTTIDNTIDVGVAIGSEPARVLVFDARPSWSSTFVRRALEDDPRFTVDYGARLAPSLAARTSNAALDSSTLEDASFVIIGAPDALTASDMALLDRFVTRRGGSLALLPERSITGPVAQFFGEGWREQLLPAAEQVGPLRATEILRIDRAPAVASVLGQSGTSPSIVALPRGNGRVIIVGAMDAWRYRDAAFDRFWTSLAAEAASAGQGLAIEVDSALAATGERVPFTVSSRSLDEQSAIEARVTARCGNSTTPLRVWPAGRIGELAGELPATITGSCEIRAAVGNRSTTTAIAVVDRPHRGVDATLASLERATRAAGGLIVESGSETDLADYFDDASADSSRIVSVHPMRAAWWIIPFAACLSAEWWLRRRAGLR